MTAEPDRIRDQQMIAGQQLNRSMQRGNAIREIRAYAHTSHHHVLCRYRDTCNCDAIAWRICRSLDVTADEWELATS